MKKTKAPKPDQVSDDLRSEYRFDYHTARPNRFAGQAKENRVVVLDPDIARVFTTPEAVNNVLRALIHTMPQVTQQDSDSQ
jgi:hypothetical protein